MLLTKSLLDVLLSLPVSALCPKQEKKESWFQTIGHYTCPNCDRSVRITYDDKVRLFVANADRAIF